MQLKDLMQWFREGQNEGRKRGYVSQGACDAEGIRLVVRALRDEVLQSPSLEDEGMVTVVDDIFDQILGSDAENEKVAGGSTREDEKAVEAAGDKGPVTVNSPATDPAPAERSDATAVCEWRQAYSAYPNRKWRVRGCTQETTHLDNLFINDKRSCPACGKPIKFTEAK